MDTLTINGISFRGDTIPLAHVSLLLIQGGKGMLGCGYVSLEAAEKFDDALAIVAGVSNYDEMLNATVKKVSSKAVELGVRVGMSGREALLVMA